MASTCLRSSVCALYRSSCDMKLTITSDGEGNGHIPAEWLAPDTKEVRVRREGDAICLERTDGKPILRRDIEDIIRANEAAGAIARE